MIQSWRNKRALTILAQLKYRKDLENNKLVFSKYYKPANNQTALELGYSLRLVRLGHKNT